MLSSLYSSFQLSSRNGIKRLHRIRPCNHVLPPNTRHRSHSPYTNYTAQRNHYKYFTSSSTKPEKTTKHASPPSTGLLSLLTDAQTEMLKEQRALSSRAASIAQELQLDHAAAATTGLGKNDVKDLESLSSRQFMFSIVVAGEFNAGKSTVINALLGKKILESGPLPTTDTITIITEDGSSCPDLENIPKENQHSSSSTASGLTVHKVAAKNVHFLKDMMLIDTPGTNAVARGHEYKTQRFLPNADLILFVLSAEKPMAESERAFLQSIQRYRKQIVVLVNKMDVLEPLGPSYGEKEKAAVLDYIESNASSLLGIRPVIFPISAAFALQAKAFEPTADMPTYGPASAQWQRSGFETLQNFLMHELSNETKIKTKLCNPIGVVEAMMQQAMREIGQSQENLETDVATLSLVEQQSQAWASEVLQDLQAEREWLQQVFGKRREGFERFLNELSLWEQGKMTLDRERFVLEWQRAMAEVEDLEASLDTVVKASSETLAIRTRRQSEAVLEYIGKRPAAVESNMIGTVVQVVGRTEDLRADLHEKMSRECDKVVTNWNRNKPEEDKVWKALRSKVLLFGSLQTGAAGAAMASCIGQFGDFYLLCFTACGLSMAGFATLPLMTKRICTNHGNFLGQLEQKVETSLSSVCRSEVSRAEREVLEGISPYTRYVRAERVKMERLRQECEDVLADSHTLRSKVLKLFQK